MQEIVRGKKKSAATLVKRVAALEAETQALKQQLDGLTARHDGPGADDWKLTVGRYKDDPTFEEAVRLGRAWRQRQPKC